MNPTSPDHVAVHTLYGETMGTRWRVCAVAAARTDLAPLHAAIQATLDGVVAQMSTWDADADISRYNRAPAGSELRLPPAFSAVLRCALEIARESDGAFDPTIGPLVAAWGFGAGGCGGRVPPEAERAAAHARVGWRRLRLGDAGTLAQPGGVALDLSGIAKGYGVDAVAGCLRARGVAAALVDVGGELYGYGRKPDGTRWRIAVEALPGAGEDTAPCVLALDGCAAATSGMRWHRFAHDGRVYAHTLDPRAGAPVAEPPAAVTVLAPDAMRADAWATALTVMGFEAGLAFAQERGLAARFVDGRTSGPDRVRTTPVFDARIAA